MVVRMQGSCHQIVKQMLQSPCYDLHYFRVTTLVVPSSAIDLSPYVSTIPIPCQPAGIISHRKGVARATFRFAFSSRHTMIAGSPIRRRGMTVLLASLFILIVILTILFLREKRSPSTPSSDPPLHPAVFVEHFSAS